MPGKLTDQDVDDIVGRMTKIGPDGKPVVQDPPQEKAVVVVVVVVLLPLLCEVLPRPTGSAPPGFEGDTGRSSSRLRHMWHHAKALNRRLPLRP